jgi:DnaJ-class molecular chaperone
MIFCIVLTMVTTRGSLVKCPFCRGSGSIGHRSDCSKCFGRGTLETATHERVQAACGGCGGSGRALGPYGDSCLGCGGRGTQEETILHREIHACRDCRGKPVTTWETECHFCEGEGRITLEQRRQLRRSRLIRALVKLLVILIVIFAMHCAMVYFTDTL